MNNLVKGAVFLFVEAYFYTKTRPAGLESFFFGWGFLFITLFLYNVFSVVFDNSSMSIAGGGNGNLINIINRYRESNNESVSNENNGDNRSGSISDRINIMYLVLLLINVIGYIRIMPK